MSAPKSHRSALFKAQVDLDVTFHSRHHGDHRRAKAEEGRTMSGHSAEHALGSGEPGVGRAVEPRARARQVARSPLPVVVRQPHLWYNTSVPSMAQW
eukprot:2964951-Rhodomonas_salina.1